ncbi:PilZ domain-containing protein (plasmid) [Leptospira sp. WS60.C2]
MEKLINNESQMYDILRILSRSVPFYLRHGEGKIQIKPISINKLGLITAIPKDIEQINTRVIFLTHNNRKLEFHFKTTLTKHNNIEILKPFALYITDANREDLHRVKNREKYEGLTVFKIINFNDVQKQLAYDHPKIDAILQKSKNVLLKKYDEANILLTLKQDARLRLYTKFGKPIFIPDKTENLNPDTNFLSFGEFSKKIVTPGLILEKYTSEICVFLEYKGYLPIGYLLVNHRKLLLTPDFEFVKLVGERVTKEICDAGFFNESADICNVVDISENGLSFLFSQSIFFIKSFAIGQIIIFELQIEDRKVPIKAIIRNIKNLSAKFRMGVQFLELNKEAAETINSYLSKSRNIESRIENIKEEIYS